MLGWGGSPGVGVSVQSILLGNGSESVFDRLNLDLALSTVLAFPHGDSKCDEHCLCVGRGRPVAADLVEFAVLRPCFPIPFTFGSAHCRSANCFPHSVS